jgi:hypothetical protein
MTAPGTEVLEATPNGEVAEVELVELIPASIPAKAEEVVAEVAAARAKAETIVVDDRESAEAALEFVKALKRQTGAIETETKSLRKPRKDAAEEIKRRYDGMQAPFNEVIAVVTEKVRVQKEKEDAEAAERQRLVEEEQARIETEARQKREAAEREEREARELAEEEDTPDAAAITEQMAADAHANAERAAVVELAIQSVPAGSPAAAPALKGFSTPKRWVAEVSDITQLPYTLPDGTPLLQVIQSALTAHMHAVIKVTGQPPEMPGAEFKQVSGSSVRT